MLHEHKQFYIRGSFLYIIQNKIKNWATYQQSLLILPNVYAAPSTEKNKKNTVNSFSTNTGITKSQIKWGFVGSLAKFFKTF